MGRCRSDLITVSLDSWHHTSSEQLLIGECLNDTSLYQHLPSLTGGSRELLFLIVVLLVLLPLLLGPAPYITHLAVFHVIVIGIIPRIRSGLRITKMDLAEQFCVDLLLAVFVFLCQKSR